MKVREDLLLTHRERVHPAFLSPEEVILLERSRSGRPRVVNTRPPPLNPPDGDTAQHSPRSPRGDGQGEDWDLPSITEVKQRLQRMADRRARPELATPELWEKVEAAHVVMESRGLRRIFGDAEDLQQTEFAALCHARWCSLAQGEADPVLVGARESLYDADSDRFKSQHWEGFQERKRAFASAIDVLTEAGERGALHLATALTVNSWASPLAADALVEMNSGPIRDRAVVESLFLWGDFAPEAGERGARTIPLTTRWPIFEEVAAAAATERVELQSLYWTSLFEEGPDDEDQRRPLPDLERAALLLYDLGHHSALAAGLDFLLEPMVSGGERVERGLKDGGLASALEIIRSRPPERCPPRKLPAEVPAE